MANIEARIQQAVEEMTGNEALLGMLETDAASEMLEWGKALAVSVIQSTEDMDDPTAEQVLAPRLKAVRQFMRSVGNWAAGLYADPGDRDRLREKLLEHLRTICGEEADLPSPEEVGALLDQVDDPQAAPHLLILKLKELLSRYA